MLSWLLVIHQTSVASKLHFKSGGIFITSDLYKLQNILSVYMQYKINIAIFLIFILTKAYLLKRYTLDCTLGWEQNNFRIKLGICVHSISAANNWVGCNPSWLELMRIAGEYNEKRQYNKMSIRLTTEVTYFGAFLNNPFDHLTYYV